MHAAVRDHLPELRRLCRQFNVARLEVFGSAVAADFDPKHSDIDLLVTFGPSGEMGEFRQYIDFVLACEAVFGRDVDLVEAPSIRNPLFAQAVEQSKALVYAA